MAGRWRAAQHRKRWTDHAALLPPEVLSLLRPWPIFEPLSQLLLSFGQQPSTYAQLSQLKQLGNALLCLLKDEREVEDEQARVLLRVVLELVFVENSKPLHRGLLSILSHVPVRHTLLLQEAFQQCCNEYGPDGAKERRFSLATVASSLSNLSLLGVVKEVIHSCVTSIGRAICYDVRGILRQALDGGRPTVADMEGCQDALSSLCYLLQNFPDQFACPQLLRKLVHGSFTIRANSFSVDASGYQNQLGLIESIRDSSDTGEDNAKASDNSAYTLAVNCLMDVLQSSALSRDCLVAAGVGLCAAAQLNTTPQGLAFTIAKFAFSSAVLGSRFAAISADKFSSDVEDQGMLEAAVLSTRNSSLSNEFEKLSEFGKLCFFRGVVTAIPRNTLNFTLLRSNTTTDQGNAEKIVNTGITGPNSENLADELWHGWTLLYDGILPALCTFCEGSVDSHFKFHVVTALQICLQQIKSSICSNMTLLVMYRELLRAACRMQVSICPYDPLPEIIISRIFRIVWNNWEDPLTQTVKQVQVIFDLLVDVRLAHKREQYSDNIEEYITGRAEPMQMKTDDFLCQMATDLLSAGRYRKGKYVPLASLALRMGAQRMLVMSPDLLFQTVHAFSDDDVCCSASTFMKSFLDRLKGDCWTAEGLTKGTTTFRLLWIPPLLSGLLSGNSKLRSNLTTYALPVALQIDVDSLLPILAFALKDHVGEASEWEHSSRQELERSQRLPEHLTVDQQVNLLISVLKVARSLALVEGSIAQRVDHSLSNCAEEVLLSSRTVLGMSKAVLWVKGQAIEIPVSLLLLALTHNVDGLRVDAAELMCLNPKTASMPSPLELCLLQIALPLNMRCSSTSFRMRAISFLKKFFLRVRTAVERQHKLETMSKVASQVNIVDTASIEMQLSPDTVHQDTVDVEHPRRVTRKLNMGADAEEDHGNIIVAVSLTEMQKFMQWLTQMLVSSLYPSAPYERKSMAMEILKIIMEVWNLVDKSQKRSGRYSSSPFLEGVTFSPYHESLLSADLTLVVVGSVVDSWDRLREASFEILVHYPTPLPGLDSTFAVERLLTWAKDLVNSPRARESDAGALVLRLVFRKYVVELGWRVKIHPDPQVSASEPTDGKHFPSTERAGSALVQYIESLNEWLECGIEEGERDLVKACRHSFVHGVLLALRYTMDEINWNGAGIQSYSTDLRHALKRLLSLVLRVTSLALWVVSADALNLQEKLAPTGPSENLDDIKSRYVCLHADNVAGDDEYNMDEVQPLAPTEQIVMVGCWLSVKEVSLLLGTLARAVPLPGCSSLVLEHDTKDRSTHINSDLTAEVNVSAMLDGQQLEAIGNHFLQVLLSMKHNGAIDKTRMGFIALCDRLLRSRDPWLNKMPEIWLGKLLEHTSAKGQVVDDLLRRSAGIPPAFLALFLAEPDGAPKKLLPFALRWLIDTCQHFLAESKSQTTGSVVDCKEDQNILSMTLASSEYRSARESTTAQNQDVIPRPLKARDEGVIPTVHAFNAMRMTFHDTNLSIDTSGFCAEGLITAIQAFGSPYWEIRNSATLAFTALVHRTIGFLNVYKRESARRAITGFEFFHRYPTLHPFLLQELQAATWQFEYGQDNGSGLVSSLHPSLGPVLIILSRLKPSLINSDVEDWLNPSAFMPYVARCAIQQNLQIRVLASHALAPLVSSEDLPVVLLQLAHSLPTDVMRETSLSSNSDPISAENVSDQEAVLPKRMSRVPPQVVSFNAIHGILLQMCTLMTSNCARLPDLVLRRQIVIGVVEVVKTCLWLGSTRLCCCHVVVGAFLDMVEVLLGLAESCLQGPERGEVSCLQDLLIKLSSNCLDDAIDDLKIVDPTRVNLRTKAAKLYFHTVLIKGPLAGLNLSSNSGQQEDIGVQFCKASAASIQNFELTLDQNDNVHVKDVTRKFTQALTDSMYEIRITTLKILRKFRALPFVTWSREGTGASVESSLDTGFGFLRTLLIERLKVETHPGCIRGILQVIFDWILLDRQRSEGFLDFSPGPHIGSHFSSEILTGEAFFMWGSGMSAIELWYTIWSIYRGARQMKTKEIAFRCLGVCIQQVLSHIRSGLGHEKVVKDLKQWNSVRGAIDAWLGLIREHSVASASVKFRRASAEAIVASGVLKEAAWIQKSLPFHVYFRNTNNENGKQGMSVGRESITDMEWYGKIVLSVWCISIKLLEDEDLHLRQSLAYSIQLVMATQLDPSQGVPLGMVVSAQEERVIQLSFEFLSAQFWQWKEYLDVLAEWVLGSEDVSNSVTHDMDLVRRLFDKEIDNHHEEELLFIQLCCRHLCNSLIAHARLCVLEVPINEHGANCRITSEVNPESLPALSSGDFKLSDGSFSEEITCWCKTFLDVWRLKFSEKAQLCAKLILLLKDDVQWVGGVTNYKDTFKVLYRSLLGLLTLGSTGSCVKSSHSREGSYSEENLISSLIKLAEQLKQLQLNPLLSNTLVQLLRSYEKQLEVDLASASLAAALGAVYNPDFEPFFLIN